VIRPEKIDATFAPRVGAWVFKVELDDESVLYDESSGGLHQLDTVATVVWDRLDGSATIDELAAELGETFATPAARVRVDLVAFARGLGRRHLLEGVAPDTADG
jgi:hypothetical protein